MTEPLDSMRRLLGWLWRRGASGLVIRVDEARMAGGIDTPALVLTLLIENPQNEGAFVDRVEVHMKTPFEAEATAYEFRDANREAIARALPVNIPSFGAEAIKVIAHFTHKLPGPSGNYECAIAATGRSGFRKRFTQMRGSWNWA